MKNNYFKKAVPFLLLVLISCNQNNQKTAQLYLQNCTICHSLDGSEKLGPSLNGIYGKKRELIDGSFVIADDEYLFNSIVNPNKDIIKGYSGSMNSFKNILSAEEIYSLIDFIKQY